LIVGAILIMTVSKGVDKIIEDMLDNNITDSQEITSLISETLPLEQIFAAEARTSKAELPIRIDEITVLSDVEAQGATLRITYQVEREIPGFIPSFKTGLANNQCSPEMFGTEIARGGIIEIVYIDLEGDVIEKFEITQEDCNQ